MLQHGKFGCYTYMCTAEKGPLAPAYWDAPCHWALVFWIELLNTWHHQHNLQQMAWLAHRSATTDWRLMNGTSLSADATTTGIPLIKPHPLMTAGHQCLKGKCCSSLCNRDKVLFLSRSIFKLCHMYSNKDRYISEDLHWTPPCSDPEPDDLDSVMIYACKRQRIPSGQKHKSTACK